MKEAKDYLFISNADINEGLTSGTVSKVAILFTKEYFFVIPFESEHFWKSSKRQFHNADEFIIDIQSKIDIVSTEELQNICIDFLPNERVYKISSLEKFKIQVGFSIFGGIHVKKYGEQLQSINIQPKATRSAIKKFYNTAL